MAIRLFRSLRKLVLLPLVFYQRRISSALPPACLYRPSCSEYAKRAILRHGILPGVLLGVIRILRCNGLLFRGGSDRMPTRLSLRAVFYPWVRFSRFSKRNTDSPES
jgi:hypothetical protein